MTTAIILAGGLGTRLRGVVNDVPKPLALVAGRPFIFWLLDALVSQGFSRVVLATGYRGELIREVCGLVWKGMAISYSHEVTPLGTGGAVAAAAAGIKCQEFFVINGDTWLHLEYAAFAAQIRDSGALLGIALANVHDVGRYGAVYSSGGRVSGFAEKGGSGTGWVNAGVYWLTREACKAFPARAAFSFERDVLEPLVDDGKVSSFSSTRGFIDIGVPEDYAAAQRQLAGMVI